jgi:3-oxoacyl-[acyl-carrier-protein] synthase II
MRVLYFQGVEMEAYIQGIGAVTPQKTFTGDGFLQEVMEYHNVRYLKCIEPVYNDFIDPMASRRMSRIVKMGVCAALKCLVEAGLENPDAIITGTGLGCIEDTEKFLGSLYTNEEQLLNPTPFIQSTHNTIAAAIALKLKCNSYNNTYVHRGFSFESALLDSMMMLQEGAASQVLTGGMDELTTHSFTITDRLGFWKKQAIHNLGLLNYKSKGSLAGEGIVFFVLSHQHTDKSLARISAINTLYKPGNKAELTDNLASFIQQSVGGTEGIDLAILGLNGDTDQDENYRQIRNSLFSEIPCAYYKHLCGEYDTSSSFALYLAAMILKEQHVPEVLKCDNKPVGKIRNVLLYNHVRNINHTMLLISSC